VALAGFLASSAAGGALNSRRQSGHSLTDQSIARHGDTQNSMAKRMHSPEREEQAS
jgi:hypothetical protein